MNKTIRRGLLIILVGGISLVAVGLIAAWISGKNGPTIDIGQGGGGELEQKDGKFIVPRNRVPQDFAARDDAPAVSLLPDRLPYENSSVTVSPKDRKGIDDAVSGFLANWETFDPLRLDKHSSATNRISPYKLGLQKWTSPGDLADIVARSDSTDPEGVCPSPGCTSGSEWASSGNLGQAITIAAFGDDQAYVTLYGIVRYTGDQQFNSLSGSLWFRSYGILLRKSSGRWLVTRAAAETTNRAST